MEFPERDPKNYKWKMFYYNPADDRVTLPKANPNMGMTLNFAKPKAYLFTLFFLFFPALIISTVIIFGK